MVQSVQSAFVSAQEACERLNIHRDTFQLRWNSVFTDWREPGERRTGFRRMIAVDELEIAVRNAGSGRARAAVLEFRKRNRRT